MGTKHKIINIIKSIDLKLLQKINSQNSNIKKLSSIVYKALTIEINTIMLYKKRNQEIC